MTAAIIAQLIVALGPSALELIPRLAAIWTKPDLTPAEVLELCAPARKSYDDYRREALATATVPAALEALRSP